MINAPVHFNLLRNVIQRTFSVAEHRGTQSTGQLFETRRKRGSGKLLRGPPIYIEDYRTIMDIRDRLLASACSDTCLMATAAKEIERLRKIEAAAFRVVAVDKYGDDQWHNDLMDLDKLVLGEE